MTDKEKQEAVDTVQKDIDEVKNHRIPSGKDDSLAVEAMQIKQRLEPTLDVYSNSDVVVKGARDGVIKAIEDNEVKNEAIVDEEKKEETERN